MPARSPLALILSLFAGAAVAQTMPHGVHGHSMHGGGPVPPVMHRIEATPGSAGLMVPELGVEIVAIHLSAAGSLVDLRYRVIDVEAAKLLMQASTPTVLIDPRTGAEGQVPVDEKVGALKQNANRVRPGQVLAVLFGNPEKALKKGDQVVIRLGGYEIAGLAIQG